LAIEALGHDVDIVSTPILAGEDEPGVLPLAVVGHLILELLSPPSVEHREGLSVEVDGAAASLCLGWRQDQSLLSASTGG
jgi:hypothetical protein